MKFSSDSLIALALNYYTITQTSPIMYAKALFYHGRVMLELDKKKGVHIDVEGNCPVEEVFNAITKAIEEMK